MRQGTRLKDGQTGRIWTIRPRDARRETIEARCVMAVVDGNDTSYGAGQLVEVKHAIRSLR